ncbi:MAG: hypothetical protein RBR87_07625 [Bacteroidales bacterium]|nr:hypothetical protein [Bacteroidales bacterium]
MDKFSAPQNTIFAAMRFWVLLFCLIYSLSATAQFSSIYHIDTLLSEQVNPQYSAINRAGTKLLFTASIDSQLYFYDFNTAIIQQFTNESRAVSASCWSPEDEKIVFVTHPEGQLKQQYFANESSLLIPERIVKASAPQFNHEGNLLLFIGQRQSQQHSHIYTYDFKYDNLNQLTRNTVAENPRWSPSDKFISFSTKDGLVKKIVLLNWYGAVDKEIKNDSLNLIDANWGDSDYKMIYVGYNERRHYLIRSRLNGNGISVLMESDFALSNPIWIPNSEKVLVTCTNYAGERMILVLNLDEQTTFEDVLFKILNE